jgi:hypothetical protein
VKQVTGGEPHRDIQRYHDIIAVIASARRYLHATTWNLKTIVLIIYAYNADYRSMVEVNRVCDDIFMWEKKGFVLVYRGHVVGLTT